MNEFEIKFAGLTAPSGRRYISASYRGVTVYLNDDERCRPPRQIIEILGRKGLIFMDGQAPEKVMARADLVDEFRPAPLIEHFGWNQQSFAVPSGKVLSPRGTHTRPSVLANKGHAGSSKGSIDAWTRGIASLNRQTIPAFFLMLAFAAPLRKLIGNEQRVGFELIAPHGSGKRTLQSLVASVAGTKVDHGLEIAGLSADSLLGTATGASDLLTIIADLGARYSGESKAYRTAAFKALVHGAEDDRFVTKAPFFIASTHSLTDVLGVDQELADTARGRIITIRSGDGGLGILDSLPIRADSGAALVSTIRLAAESNPAHAMHRFATRLVNEWANDKRGLLEWLNKKLARFREMSGVDLNDGATLRVVDEFGLVYAAGLMAREYEVLPEGWDCGPTVLRCYHKHHIAPFAPEPFVKRLEALLGRSDVIDFDAGGSAPTDAELAAAKVFKKTIRGRVEVMIRSADIYTIFPDWDRLQRQTEVLARLRRDGDHLKVPRRISPGKREHLHSFGLPAI